MITIDDNERIIPRIDPQLAERFERTFNVNPLSHYVHFDGHFHITTFADSIGIEPSDFDTPLLPFLLSGISELYGEDAVQLIRDIVAYSEWYQQIAPDNRHLESAKRKRSAYRIAIFTDSQAYFEPAKGTIVWPFAYRNITGEWGRGTYRIDHLPTGLHVWDVHHTENNKEIAHSLCQQFAQIAPQYDSLTNDQIEQMREILRNV